MASLSNQAAPPPQGFELIPNAASEGAWSALQEWLETDILNGSLQTIAWEIGAQNRRVAQFGFRYDYDKDVVDTTTPTPPIPSKLYKLLNIPLVYTQCIINTYPPDIFIPWHKDDLQFGDTVLVYCFGEARPLLLRNVSNHSLQYTATAPHCSKYTLTGEARYEWEHMVPTGNDFRVSFTFRTLGRDDNKV